MKFFTNNELLNINLTAAVGGRMVISQQHKALDISSHSMTALLTLISLTITIILTGCIDNPNKAKTEIINFKDTLYKTKILVITNGDTIRRHDTIYFKPTDLAINTSKFHYGVNTNVKASIYEVFFPRDKVVAFCDSMLNVLPTYKNQGDEDVFYKGLIYEHIKEQAHNDKMDEAIYVDELPTLLDRFNPLVVDFKTNDKPSYIIISSEDTKYAEYKYYNIKTNLGDTVLLAVVCIKPQEMVLDK